MGVDGAALRPPARIPVLLPLALQPRGWPGCGGHRTAAECFVLFSPVHPDASEPPLRLSASGAVLFPPAGSLASGAAVRGDPRWPQALGLYAARCPRGTNRPAGACSRERTPISHPEKGVRVEGTVPGASSPSVGHLPTGVFATMKERRGVVSCGFSAPAAPSKPI